MFQATQLVFGSKNFLWVELYQNFLWVEFTKTSCGWGFTETTQPRVLNCTDTCLNQKAVSIGTCNIWVEPRTQSSHKIDFSFNPGCLSSFLVGILDEPWNPVYWAENHSCECGMVQCTKSILWNFVTVIIMWWACTSLLCNVPDSFLTMVTRLSFVPQDLLSIQRYIYQLK